MSAQNIAQYRTQINRGVYGLLSTVIIVFALILIVLQLQHNEHNQRDTLANDHHLAVSKKGLELLSVIDKTKLWFRNHYIEGQNKNGTIDNELLPSLIHLEFSERDKIDAFKHEIGRIIGEIIATQTHYADPEFETITSLLRETYRRVQSGLDELESINSYSYNKIDAVVAPLISVTHQLQRLHQNAYQEMRLSEDDFQRKNLAQLISLIVALTVIGLLGVVRMLRHVRHALIDLTTAQQELQSQARIIDQIHDSVVSTDLEGVITSWNKGAERLFGYAREEMLGKHIAAIYPEEDHVFLQNEVIAPLQAKGERQTEVRMQRKSGEDFFAHLSLSLQYDEQGNAVGMIGYSIDITERKQAEEALQAASELNEKIISESPIGIAIYDSMGQCLAVNTSLAKMVGATREQTLMQNYNTIKSWQESGLLALAKKATSNHSKELMEIRVHTTFGKTVYFDFRIIPFQIKDKTNLLLMADDITERKAIEDSLKESEVLLETAQTLANIGSWKLITATGEVTGSNELFSIFGLSRDEATLDAFVEVVHPDDREMDVAAIQRGAEHGESWDIEHRLVCRDGKEKWVHAIGEAVIDEAGDVVELLGTVQDITKLKKTGIALLESELWMRSIYNSLDEAVLVVTPDRKIVNINDATLRITGYSAQEIFNSSTELFHVDHQHYVEFGERITQAFSRDLTANFEFVAKRKNGEVFPTEHTVSLLKSPDGKPKGIVSVFRDISMRKQAEDELVKHREHLEELVEERTHELREAQDELIHKERLATLGQLTATVSHELRNPLGAMRPSIYVIKKKSDKNDKRVQKAIERIDRNIDRCDNIIDELLDFTRITKLNRHVTRFDEWLESVINEQDIPKGIQIEKNFSLKDVELAIDTNRLRRVVINVMDNACHAMLDGKLQAKAKQDFCLGVKTGGNDERIEISITDTGTGITKDVLKKIFEPLFSTKGFGVGLGMPTVKQIMEQHGGGIDIDTKEGEGTNVTLWLPRNIAGEDDKGVAA